MRLDFARARVVRVFCLFSRSNSKRLAFLAVWLFLAGCTGGKPAAVFSTPDGPKRVLLELAVTAAERNRGLMFRPRLDPEHGMLFVFEKPGQPPFWMKNTYLSLDILFLSEEGVVVDLFERLPPCPMEPCPRYKPRAPCRYVLEVAAGFVARHSVRIGDRVRFEDLPEAFSR